MRLLFFPNGHPALSYRDACTVGKFYSVFQIIVQCVQISMIPQAMMITTATSCLLQIPRINEDRKLRNFHFSHLKHIWKFLLLGHQIVHLCEMIPCTITKISPLAQQKGQKSGAFTFSDFKVVVTHLVRAFLAGERIDSTSYR